jgi:hypothetical protein
MSNNIPSGNNYVSILLPNNTKITIFLRNMKNIGDLKNFFRNRKLNFIFKYENKVLSDTLSLNEFIKDYSKNRNSNRYILIAERDSSSSSASNSNRNASSSSAASSASKSNRYAASSNVNSRRPTKLSLVEAKKIINNEYQGNYFTGIEKLRSINMINDNLSAQLYQDYEELPINLSYSSSSSDSSASKSNRYAASSNVNSRRHTKLSSKSAAGNISKNVTIILLKEILNNIKNKKISSTNKNIEKIKKIRKVIDLYIDDDKVSKIIMYLKENNYITPSEEYDLQVRYFIKKRLNNNINKIIKKNESNRIKYIKKTNTNNRVNSILKTKTKKYNSLIRTAIDSSNLNKNTKDHYIQTYL